MIKLQANARILSTQILDEKNITPPRLLLLHLLLLLDHLLQLGGLEAKQQQEVLGMKKT